jgi:biotin carboxylase
MILLLLPTTSYKATDFLEAAEHLGVAVVVGTDRRQVLEDEAPGTTLALDFNDAARAKRLVSALPGADNLRAVLGVDDETTVVAAELAAVWGLPHNPVEAVRRTRDKYALRVALERAGLRGPAFFRRVARDESPEIVAGEVAYPCVLKPLSLSASRGVLRADDPAGFVAAFRRIESILDAPDVRKRGGDREHLLVEEYLDGDEVAVEGLLEGGSLHPLAIFDKPDPLRGPTFEETIYVTPSRHDGALQRAVLAEVGRAAAAAGLTHGPLHAELRLTADGPCLLEIAPRTIGGLCARTLRFGAGISLEELVLRHALGLEINAERESAAAGVMMLPVPQAGILRKVRGLPAAQAIEGVVEITISMHAGSELTPLPEGNRYLGFVFARGGDPAIVEAALRAAHAKLEFEIDPA